MPPIKQGSTGSKSEAPKYLQIAPEVYERWGLNDYNNIAPVYDQIMGADMGNIIFKKYEPILQSQPNGAADKKYLDLCCGTGSFLRKVAGMAGPKAQLHGIDLSNGQLEVARAKAQDAGVTMSFQNENVVSAEFPQECDVITMNLDTMNHLRQPADWLRVMEKACNALKPGGVFLFDINTQKRLREDLMTPEVIIKPDLSYIQAGIKLEEFDGWVRQQHLMQIFQKHDDGSIKEYNARIQHIAPTEETLVAMLLKAGFANVTKVPFSRSERAEHIFLKNRLFLKATK